MTRILHVLDHSLPTHSGYTFRTRALMKAQVAKGWEVAGVTGVRHPEPGPDGETVDGLTFYRTAPIAPARAPIREWREIGALARRVEALAREWQPDVLHAHSPVLDGLAALRVGKRLGIPVIYEIRAFWEDASVGNGTGSEGSLRYWLTKQLETHAVKAADAVAVRAGAAAADHM